MPRKDKNGDIVHVQMFPAFKMYDGQGCSKPVQHWQWVRHNYWGEGLEKSGGGDVQAVETGREGGGGANVKTKPPPTTTSFQQRQAERKAQIKLATYARSLAKKELLEAGELRPQTVLEAKAKAKAKRIALQKELSDRRQELITKMPSDASELDVVTKFIDNHKSRSRKRTQGRRPAST